MADHSVRSGAPAPGADNAFHLHLERPERPAKTAPCQAGCPAGGDVRGWLGILAQREKLGLSEDDARRQAWNVLAARNPMPATTGRVCPHPCEEGCNRGAHDGSVSINALERFLGDWSLEHGIALPREEGASHAESIGVIGSGPAGLSFAYQMARRGYPVTIYEKHDKPGGMLTYGIPEYRLPAAVVEAEIQRIVDAGVRLELSAAIGTDLSIDELHRRHVVLFLGIGAQRARLLQVDGEEGPGVWGGTSYLELVNAGHVVDVGRRVVVVGGGNTAIDAARTARRTGAQVTLLYRRTRQEMPAIPHEIDEALEEGVVLESLSAPVAILRDGDALIAVRAQQMQLGAPDASGRRSPVPVPGAFRDIAADTVIAAVSQEPDWSGLENVSQSIDASAASPQAWIGTGLIAGGDVLGLGLVSLALGHGRTAAEAVHARLRGLPSGAPQRAAEITSDRIKADCYDTAAPVEIARRSAGERLAEPDREAVDTIDAEAFAREAARCFSCGSCFGCQRCAMYCNATGYTRLAVARPGAYFALALDRCEGCGKCIELCPCGFLDKENPAPAGAPC